MVLMRKSQHIANLREHLSRFNAKPSTRIEFNVVLGLVAGSVELEQYFPELFVLGEHLFGSLAPDFEDADPWVALSTSEQIWSKAVDAYRYGNGPLRGLTAYAVTLRELGYTNDE